jgi:shikimate kinase
MIIYIIGFMGCGKSTSGRLLAHHLHYEFVDLDILFQTKLKMNIPAYFEKYGEEAFRKSEYEILRQIDTNKNMVVATGGGTPCFSDNMAYLKKTGVTVYLQLTPALLYKRLTSSHTVRPLVTGKKPEELKTWIEELVKERTSYYKKAHIIIDARNLSQSLLIRVLTPYLTKEHPLDI